MRKNRLLKKLILLVIVFLILICTVVIISYKSVINKPLKSEQKTIVVEVKQGEGFYDILNKLEKDDRISNKFFLKLKLSFDETNVNLREGIYEIDTNITLADLINTLQNKSNDKGLVKLTIPEGYSIDEIASTIEQKEICSKEDFLKAVKNYNLPKYVKVNDNKRYNLEGYLYPDTYLLEKGIDPNDIIEIMLKRFEDILNQVKEDTKVDIKVEDVEKIINIASIIEKEAKVSQDRELISSVIYNRLDKKMKLQIDACVIYALGYRVEVVLNKHLKIDSPYNVYKYNGLPIGPIGNPGIDCIKAAIVPAKTDYLYYILQKDGSHYFTKSFDDFSNKKKELGY